MATPTPIIRLFRLLKRVFLSGLLTLGLPPNSCRFTPSCSHYCDQALSKYGLLYGGWLCFKRVSRCHPLSPGGYDPVP